MKYFTQLLTQLEKAATPDDREIALLRYFDKTTSLDRMWGLWLLTDRKPRKSILPLQLRSWTIELTGFSVWLFEESLATTGDLSETCALLFRENPDEASMNLSTCVEYILTLPKEEITKKNLIIEAWNTFSPTERYWFNRLLLGNFRFKLNPKTLVTALGKFSKKENHTLWYRLVGDWSPRDVTFEDLFLEEKEMDNWLKPIFFKELLEVEPLLKPVANIAAYQAEWFWEGIRTQLIKRGGQLFIWSAEGEWLTGKFPELDAFGKNLPDGSVLEGNILGLLGGSVLESKLIFNRAKRKKASSKLLKECPAVFLANDLLEYKGDSLEDLSLTQRLDLLQEIQNLNPSDALILSESLPFKNWTQLKTILPDARDEFAKGILLRNKKGNANVPDLFLPCPPLNILVLLLYVSRDDRKPGRFSELSFGVWKNDDIVPIAKCVNNLSEEENEDLKTFVQQNTIERFGPVISVQAELVFNISFTGLLLSGRKKSGLDVQNPVLKSWEKTSSIDEAVDLAELHQLQRKLSGETD